jgi:hypothetical protein
MLHWARLWLAETEPFFQDISYDFAMFVLIRQTHYLGTGKFLSIRINQKLCLINFYICWFSLFALLVAKLRKINFILTQ